MEPIEWLTVHEAALRMGVTQRTVYRLVDTDGLPAYPIGRLLRFQCAEVDVYIESRRIKPGDLSHLYPMDVEVFLDADDKATLTLARLIRTGHTAPLRAGR